MTLYTKLSALRQLIVELEVECMNAEMNFSGLPLDVLTCQRLAEQLQQEAEAVKARLDALDPDKEYYHDF